MIIYIVSSGRSKNQITLNQIPKNTKHTVILFVPKDETEEYRLSNPDQIVIWHSAQKIRATRQTLIENHEGKLLMLDDDLTFYRRQEKGNFLKARPNDVEEMFDKIEEKLNEFAHVSVLEKFMSQAQPRDFILNKRYYQVLGYNTKLFPLPPPKFRVEIAEELDFSLQLMSRGLNSCILTEWAKSDKSHAPGGCELWRTNDVENEAHFKMAELWPGIVKVVESKKFSGTKLRISWNKI